MTNPASSMPSPIDHAIGRPRFLVPAAAPQDTAMLAWQDLSYADPADGQFHTQVAARANHDDDSLVDFGVETCPPQGNIVERAGPRKGLANRSRDRSSWWRLVWCHERCLKEENEVRRKVLSEAARECGALLICLKKASKFEKWLAQEQRPPFVLLTDWKEVKPCIQIASLQAQQSQLAFTIALCETEADFSRVSLWTQNLKGQNQPVCNYRVHVWKDIGNPRSFTRQVLECLEGKNQLPSQSRSSPGEPSHSDEAVNGDSAKESLRSYENKNQLQSGVHRFGRSGGKARGRGKGRGATRCGKEPAARTLPSSAEFQWDRPVYSPAEQQILLPEAGMSEVNVLSPVCASHSNGQLEQLLKQAMPDHYDE